MARRRRVRHRRAQLDPGGRRARRAVEGRHHRAPARRARRSTGSSRACASRSGDTTARLRRASPRASRRLPRRGRVPERRALGLRGARRLHRRDAAHVPGRPDRRRRRGARGGGAVAAARRPPADDGGIAAGWLLAAGAALAARGRRAACSTAGAGGRARRRGRRSRREAGRASAAGVLAIAAAGMAVAAFAGGDGDDPAPRAAATATATAGRAGRRGARGPRGLGARRAAAAATRSPRPTATAPIGPDLDANLRGMPAAYVKESIVAPDAAIAAGYSAGTMPEDYAQRISPADLDRLVTFIVQGVAGLITRRPTGARGRARAPRRRARRRGARARSPAAGRRASLRRCVDVDGVALRERASAPAPRSRRGRRAPRPARRPASPGPAPSSSGAVCIRLTTSPPNGIRASRSLRWKKIASSTGSCRGEVTIRNVVPGSASSAPTRSARAAKPSIMPPSERKKTDRSSSRSTPVTRRSSPKATPVPRPMMRPPRPGGAEEDLDRAALEEAGQPRRRVEEVERVARGRRVEHEQVEVAARVEVVELGDRRELLRAGDGVGELLVDPVREHLVARARVGREVLDQLVERPLGVEHQRPQLAAHLDAVLGEALRVDQPRLVAELLEPERVRQPPGGVDGHHGDLGARGGGAHRERGGGRRLADAARAGADHDPAARR